MSAAGTLTAVLHRLKARRPRAFLLSPYAGFPHRFSYKLDNLSTVFNLFIKTLFKLLTVPPRYGKFILQSCGFVFGVWAAA